MADDAPQLVHAFRKNSQEEVRCELTTYRGHELIGLRVFYTRPDGTLVPTAKGITLARALLPELETAVQRLREAITAGEGVAP